MTIRHLIRAALLGVAISSTAAAQAFSIDFDDPAIWGQPAAGSTFGGVSLTNATGDAFILPTSFACSALVCDGVVQGQVGGSLGFSFAGGASSLQFGLVRGVNRRSVLTLFNSAGTAFSTQTIIPTLQNDPTFGSFFGATFSWTSSGTAAYSALLTHEFTTGQEFEAFELDKLTGSLMQPVPEPASVALLGTGLVGLLVARRRRA